MLGPLAQVQQQPDRIVSDGQAHQVSALLTSAREQLETEIRVAP